MTCVDLTAAATIQKPEARSQKPEARTSIESAIKSINRIGWDVPKYSTKVIVA